MFTGFLPGFQQEGITSCSDGGRRPSFVLRHAAAVLVGFVDQWEGPVSASPLIRRCVCFCVCVCVCVCVCTANTTTSVEKVGGGGGAW